jgi:formiminotetrahydrofolate cyclodeaminase
MRISVRKQADEPLYSIEEDKLCRIAGRLLILAEADSNSFGSFIIALQMPKGTEDEKESRRQAMRSATVEATKVAIETLHASNEMLQSATAIRAKVLKSIVADVRAGAEFAATMAAVARANAETNLTSLPAGPTRDDFQRTVEKARQLNETLLNECRGLNEACTD